jgi:hypothetical protein
MKSRFRVTPADCSALEAVTQSNTGLRRWHLGDRIFG